MTEEQAHHRIARVAAGSFETRHERKRMIATVRSHEFERVKHKQQFEQDGISVDIESVKLTPWGQIEVFARAGKVKIKSDSVRMARSM